MTLACHYQPNKWDIFFGHNFINLLIIDTDFEVITFQAIFAIAGAIISQIFFFCLATILASEDNGDLDHGDCDAFDNENGDYDKPYGFTWNTLGLLLKTHGAAPDVQLKLLQISFDFLADDFDF